MSARFWNEEDIKNWKEKQKVQRSYSSDIIGQIKNLKNDFTVSQYGTLNYSLNVYPLYLIHSENFDVNKRNILITGGVHGYETSGTVGAIQFMKEHASQFTSDFNFVCAPCISPWGYETINRWTPRALDPNRNFFPGSNVLECQLLLEALDKFNIRFIAHFDLHETTDTDNTIFRPLLEKRDGIKQEVWDIPNGFYLVGDTGRIEQGFQDAIIKEVNKFTHIAPADAIGNIIGVKTSGSGIINYDVKKLFLCTGITNAPYVTTTEVYPDSSFVTTDECNRAQVAAIIGGLNFITN